MLDGCTEERNGRAHEHRRRHTFAADIPDDEGDIVAVTVEIIQVTADTLHRYQRSMERKCIIIDEIVHQDTPLDILRYLHLVLDEFVLILHLEIYLLVLLNPAE